MTDGCTTGGTFDPLNVKSDAEALMWQWRLHWHEPGFWCPVTSFEQFALLLGASIYQLRRAGSTKVYNCTGTTTYAAAPVPPFTDASPAGGFKRGHDCLEPGADHRTYGIDVGEWENQIDVYGDPALRDRVLNLLVASTNAAAAGGTGEAGAEGDAAGYVERVGWVEADGQRPRRFTATVVFPNGPPALPASTVWKRTPVHLVLAPPGADPTPSDTRSAPATGVSEASRENGADDLRLLRHDIAEALDNIDACIKVACEDDRAHGAGESRLAGCPTYLDIRLSHVRDATRELREHFAALEAAATARDQGRPEPARDHVAEAVAVEREACAMEAEFHSGMFDMATIDAIAAAIRARTSPPQAGATRTGEGEAAS